ncbi:MAG: AtzE family amidohydrolase [Pseudomonadota bacterium]
MSDAGSAPRSDAGGNPFAAETAASIARAVREGRVRAIEVAHATLDDIDRRNPQLNAFTEVTRARALAEAAAVDAALARGDSAGPLAGVPFAVKNLFDIEGVVTLAGSRINRGRAPAAADAGAVARLRAAGAVLVGALNMDEYAYGFSTENSHYGPTCNPHDPARIAGGSSGGSGAAAAAGLVPLALGTDTNGSIRVPASLCGLFGLKPTYGRLSRAGGYLFVGSLDHIGPLARSAADLALAYDAMQGPDAADPVCAQRPVEPTLAQVGRGIDGLRIAVADGYFARPMADEARSAVQAVAEALGASLRVDIPEAGRGRAAAFLMTAIEGGLLHLPDLKSRAADFDPLIRDRMLAGAIAPAHWLWQAHRVRRHVRDRALSVFAQCDVIIAPCTPMSAPEIGTEWITLEGERMLARPNLGLFTQPISFLGWPVAAVPVARPPGMLPIGVQVIAAPWREDLCLRVAAHLECLGIAAALAVLPD